MLIIDTLHDLHGQFDRVSMALGTFDGVHLAHRFVIGKTVEWADLHGGTSMVFTFANHPLSVINPQRVPPQLQTVGGKTQQIRKMGVRVLVRIPFTSRLLHLPPADFVELLARKIKPSHIVVGPNYSFGDKGAGTPDMLLGLASNHDIETEICPAVYQDGVMVSSTAIRRLIAAGEMDRATALLGRHYELSGIVVDGDHRGRSLGFPTANLKVAPSMLLPGKGVYAVWVRSGGKAYAGLCNIGINPTFSHDGLRVETHILDFNRDIYGKKLTLYFLDRLRVEKAFPSKTELIAQLAADVAQAREKYFQAPPR